MFISADPLPSARPTCCGRYRLDHVIERYASTKAEITATCPRKDAINLIITWRAMTVSAEGACDCNDHLAVRGASIPFPAPLWPPPSALSTVSRRVSRVFDISPRLSCPVRIWPLKESNAGQCNWSPRSFSGQSIAQIVRVTSPACRGAHVSDATERR